jgi:hypothetical protein
MKQKKAPKIDMTFYLTNALLAFSATVLISKVKQSRYTPWRRLEGEEV